MRGGLVYSVSGQGALGDTNILFVSDLLAEATGYGANVSGALAEFFRNRVRELQGQGLVTLDMEAYHLHIEVETNSEGALAIDFTLNLQEVDWNAFPSPSYSLGPPDARYVIREFSDFQCPYCAAFARSALPAIKEQLLGRGDVRFEFHHFPLKSIHPNAAPAAIASECVRESYGNSGFWSFHDALFDSQSEWSSSTAPGMTFSALAKKVGLGGAEVTKCIAEGKFAPTVEAAYQAAGSLGINSTPTVFVGGFRVQSFLDIRAYLDLFALVDAFELGSNLK
jgi:protein-disulfide isomerase